MHVLMALSPTPPAQPPDDATPLIIYVLMGMGVLSVLLIVFSLWRGSLFLPHDPDARDREWPT